MKSKKIFDYCYTLKILHTFLIEYFRTVKKEFVKDQKYIQKLTRLIIFVVGKLSSSLIKKHKLQLFKMSKSFRQFKRT